jgi:hypothetical protein
MSENTPAYYAEILATKVVTQEHGGRTLDPNSRDHGFESRWLW